MAGPFIDNAKWKEFLDDDEAAAVSELETAINFHREQIKTLREMLAKHRKRHIWKTRKQNPYQGGKRETSSN